MLSLGETYVGWKCYLLLMLSFEPLNEFDFQKRKKIHLNLKVKISPLKISGPWQVWLSKNKPPPMFLMDNTKMDRIATKIKLKTHILFTMSEFDNYYKIAVRDHIRTPKFWRKWRTLANTKKQISGVKHFI